MALVIISHDLGVVAELADRVTVMYAGRAVETASVERLFDTPRHPYTTGLLAALPDLERTTDHLVAIPGQVPEPSRLPPGCAFGARCSQHDPALCDTAVPIMRAVAPDHLAACTRLATTGAAVARAEAAS